MPVPVPQPPGRLLPREQSWEPGAGGTGAVHVHRVIMLDGSKIAEAVHSHTAAGMQFPTQAPMFNGREGYTAPDWAPIHGMA
jgi:hypothetical protein